MYRSNLERYNSETGKWPLVSNPKDGCTDLPVDIPCGRCVFCRLKNSFSKSVRIVHELDSWSSSSFLTLTYEDDNIPLTDAGVPTLTRGQSGDLTKFFKRLRKHLRRPLKYFSCAEYGERTARPHYHSVLYGADFMDDRVLLSNQQYPLYRSDLLNSIWGHGNCVIGSVTWESASYVASYVLKKLVGDDAVVYDELDIVPPYMVSSLGLGRAWIDKWLYDVYPRDTINVRGHLVKPPRYYDDRLKTRDLRLHKKVIERRRDVEFDEEYHLNAISANIKKTNQLEFFKNPKI